MAWCLLNFDSLLDDDDETLVVVARSQLTEHPSKFCQGVVTVHLSILYHTSLLVVAGRLGCALYPAMGSHLTFSK